MIVIEVKNLVKRYGTHVAVDHISFTIEKGKIYGFLGPNGAGKSTTMNMMTGYIAPSEGEIIINGHDILEEPEEAKACIGYLPEFPPLYPDMTVEEYLVFAAGLKGIDKSEQSQAIDQVVHLTKLKEVRHRLIQQLSKGYKQRVGLAQAVLGLPEVIILDEPTVGLDPRQIIEIRDLIKTLAQKHTVILSSHIMQEISAVCDNIIIIAEGKIIANDTTENISRMASDQNHLELQIQGEPTAIKNALIKALPNAKVTNSSVSNYQGNLATLQVVTDIEEDVRVKVFETCARLNMPILEMKLLNPTLEEIFLDLVSRAEKRKPAKKTKLNLFPKKIKLTGQKVEESPRDKTAEPAQEPAEVLPEEPETREE